MAKKRKSNILNSVMSTDKSVDISVDTEKLNNIKIETVSENCKITKPDINYDNLTDIPSELTKLTKTNADLTDKIANYIENIELLSNKYEQLKDEYDNSLIKIAELSFENATLNAKIDELSKQINSQSNKENILNHQQIQNTQSINVPYIKQNYNGYSDWN